MLYKTKWRETNPINDYFSRNMLSVLNLQEDWSFSEESRSQASTSLLDLLKENIKICTKELLNSTVIWFTSVLSLILRFLGTLLFKVYCLLLFVMNIIYYGFVYVSTTFFRCPKKWLYFPWNKCYRSLFVCFLLEKTLETIINWNILGHFLIIY